MDARPVGVFDSGMGGLTVLHELLVTLPHEDFVYLGDAARLPYGPRPLPEIRRFLDVARRGGALGASLWSWQHANANAWAALSAFPWDRVPNHR